MLYEVITLCARRQHRLLAVVGRHHAAAPREVLLHLREPLLREHQIDAHGFCRDFLGKIVNSGAQATVDNDRVSYNFV